MVLWRRLGYDRGSAQDCSKPVKYNQPPLILYSNKEKNIFNSYYKKQFLSCAKLTLSVETEKCILQEHHRVRMLDGIHLAMHPGDASFPIRSFSSLITFAAMSNPFSLSRPETSVGTQNSIKKLVFLYAL